MGLYGGFVYGSGTVYGSSLSVNQIDVVGKNLLTVFFTVEVVVNSTYLDTATYSIVRQTAGDDITVRSVLLPENDIKVINHVQLEVSQHSVGTRYELTATDMTTTGGAVTSTSGEFLSTRTKTDVMMASVPRHFNANTASTVRGVIEAIGVMDDLIGGSRNDLELLNVAT